ncbi:MAG: hypothetical protein ACW99G_02600 [Candidatus Thorarchaeota archaeon]|jgi:hypothetical protein
MLYCITEYFANQKRRKLFYELYAQHGGKPYVGSHDRLREGSKADWDKQNKDNQDAREKAKEESGYIY